MTSYREGYCKACGEHSQSVSIDRLGLCSACAYPVGVCANCGKPLPCDCAAVEKYFKEHRGQKIADGVYKHKLPYQRGFDAGRKAALRSKNSSGCACVFGEEGNLIEVCKAHTDWLNECLDGSISSRINAIKKVMHND